MSESVGPVVTLTMTVEQAAAAHIALDLLARLGTGQLEFITDLVRDGIVPVANRNPGPDASPILASAAACEEVDTHLRQAKRALGYSSGSHGVGHRGNPVIAMRSYEVSKVLIKALMEHRDPEPRMRSADYDGLVVRYTTDPEPKAHIQ